ncbi:DUF86 domain-containing protein [Agrobacterium sp. NPDC090273]|uniref:HepT-like ribonuclease domain-containing protein n=1 Tax=Agrobacterium sp. NPDC090273 TaxID=3363919 RepID=UPI00383A90BA
MKEDGLLSYLDDMRLAANKSRLFLRGINEQEFNADERTQMATMMALALIGEAASRIDTLYPAFVSDHPEIAWSKIRAMKNLIAYDHYRAELPLLWRTASVSIPELLDQLDLIRDWHTQGE